MICRTLAGAGLIVAAMAGGSTAAARTRPEHFLAGDAYRCAGPTILLRRSAEQKYQFVADWYGLDGLVAKLTSDGASKALGCIEIWVTCTSDDADMAFLNAIVGAGASFKKIETTQDRDLLAYPRETKLTPCVHAH